MSRCSRNIFRVLSGGVAAYFAASFLFTWLLHGVVTDFDFYEGVSDASTAAVLIFSTIAVLQYNVARVLETAFPNWFSGVMDCAGTTRVEFGRSRVSYPEKLATAHTHPKAAKDRSAANSFIKHLAQRTGRRPYSVSMSAADMRDASVDGCRNYYFAKDYLMEERNDQFDPDKHHLMMVDVDYYLDVNEYLKAASPLTLYTFAPLQPAGKADEYTWRTNADGEIIMEVSGGAKYQHKLWDFNVDHLLIYNEYADLYIAYNVDSKATEDVNRRIVHFTPKRVYTRYALEGRSRTLSGYTFIGKVLRYLSLAGMPTMPKHLERRELLVTETVAYTRSANSTPGAGVMHHIALVGSHLCADISDNLWHACYMRYASSTKAIPTDLERLLNKSGSITASEQALLLHTCFTNGLTLCDVPVQTIPAPDNANMFQTTGPLLLEDADKGGLRALCPPLYGTAFCPAKSYNNDLAMKKGRLDKVQQRKPADLPFVYQSYTAEFIEHVLGAARATLSPYPFDEVCARQSRPSQRMHRENAENWLDVVVDSVTSFQKREAYDKVSAPRNISNVSVQNKTMFSQFTYMFYDEIFGKLPWVVSGMNPRELTQSIMEYVDPLERVESGDISRMDGSYAYELHQVFRAILVGAFKPQHQAAANELVEQEISAKGKTANGVHYDTGSTTLSGSPITSMRNTNAVAFVCYCALRNSNLGKEEAWAKLGRFAGDDSLQGYLPAENLEKEFKKFNMEYKRNTVPRHEPLLFLGRYFLDPWTTKACIADVPRQMRKIHLTDASVDVPFEVVWKRKVESYLITDPDTPFLSDFCKIVKAKLDELAKRSEKKAKRGVDIDTNGTDRRWFALFEKENQFTPPTSCAEIETASRIVSEGCGFTCIFEFGEHVARLYEFARDRSLDDFLSDAAAIARPEFPKIQVDASVGNELVIAAEPLVIPEERPLVFRKETDLNKVLSPDIVNGAREASSTDRAGQPGSSSADRRVSQPEVDRPLDETTPSKRAAPKPAPVVRTPAHSPRRPGNTILGRQENRSGKTSDGSLHTCPTNGAGPRQQSTVASGRSGSTSHHGPSQSPRATRASVKASPKPASPLDKAVNVVKEVFEPEPIRRPPKPKKE